MKKIIQIAPEQEVSFELAGALHDVGFPYPKHNPDYYPTLNVAQRWLRLALGKEMEIQGCDGYYTVYVYGSVHGFIYKHTQKANNRTSFKTYEEAQEAGMLTMFDLF